MRSDSQSFAYASRLRGKAAQTSLKTALSTVLALAVCGLPAYAQQPSGGQNSGSQSSDSQSPGNVPPPSRGSAPPEAPALIEPTGPEVTLESSEALFDIAAALNSCGYDRGLSGSDPLRQQVREEVNQALLGSAEARDAHDRVCRFLAQHRLADPGLDLAQYISLALYTTPPPNLVPSAEDVNLPPDSIQVVEILPLLRNFGRLADLHAIWLRNRPQYDEELNQLHDSLARMIVETNAYLKLQAATASHGRRFLVVIEPLLDPGETNARVYGTDYVVVASPVNAVVHMNEVRHTYLHYVLEPLLYDNAASMNRLQPFLKVIGTAPVDDADHNDVVALTVECMIRAIEARTMDTGIAIDKIPDGVSRGDREAAIRRRDASMAQADAVRRAAVERAVAQGYVLTSYFYSSFADFEKQPQSFQQSFADMIYGMDVGKELNQAKHIDFAQQAAPEVVQRAGQPAAGLDLAEGKLTNGDADGAAMLAEQVLKGNSGDAARANFILARAAILNRDVDTAQKDFAETIRLAKDPRLLAWSHIYLGRLYDIEDERDHAVSEYQAALVARDDQPDTKSAAEEGLKQPYAVPQRSHTAGGADSSDPSDPSGDAARPPASAGGQVGAPGVGSPR